MSRKNNCKSVILDAAEAVVMRAGAAHMSLDMVAKEAGVSKGGLMYHFPTKESLLQAMMTRMIEQFYADREQKKRSLKAAPSRLLKAGILAGMERTAKVDGMALSILAAAAYDPRMLEPLRRAHAEHEKELENSGLAFERAAVLSLAADGLMFNELLRVSPYSAARRQKIKQELLRMVDEGVAAA